MFRQDQPLTLIISPLLLELLVQGPFARIMDLSSQI